VVARFSKVSAKTRGHVPSVRYGGASLDRRR
jgi:hypothetical protein